MAKTDILVESGETRIIRNADKLDGRPSIEGTNIGVFEVSKQVVDENMTTADVVDSYPHLGEKEVRVAVEYYQNNTEEMNRIHRRNQEIRNLQSGRVYICDCGEKRDAPDNHFSKDTHSVDEIRSSVNYACSCDRQFDSAQQFRSHQQSENGTTETTDEHTLSRIYPS